MGADASAAQGIREAIAEAVDESNYLTELETSLDGLVPTGSPSADSSATEGEEAASGDVPAGEGASEAQQGTEEDPPSEYWGTSLEGLSAEQRKEVLAALEQRDSLIQQLQQKIAEAKPPELPSHEQDTPVEITDDDLLRALGIDPEGDTFEVDYAKKHTLPLARQVMALEDTVESIQQTEQIREVSTYWNVELDRLEAENGPLPGDRLQVLQYAANEGVSSPELLYYRLAMPIKKAVDAEVAKVRKLAAQKAASGGLRPRSTDGGSKVLDTEGKSLRDTVKEAAIQAQEETGFNWKDVLTRR